MRDPAPGERLPHRIPTEFLWTRPVPHPTTGLLVRVLTALRDSESHMRQGTGRRQQQILQLLADGAPRDCLTIAEDLRISPHSVHETITVMHTRHWVCEVGRARHWPTRVWQINSAGRQQIPPECSQQPRA
ncbi:hypothetical protein [Nocardia sp. BMG51109]|uniref:hypothetical protein n=1 Tax=Nocardia sp. BMG51109 TaxID=1056816 RepID=UPI000464DD4A|nr:hypothetical protein [Nocardia sp. BMG51109]